MMEFDTQKLDDLFDFVCERARVSVRQSRDAIVRQSRRRLASDVFDAPAMHVVAASSLVRENAEESLRILGLESAGDGARCGGQSGGRVRVARETANR